MNARKGDLHGKTLLDALMTFQYEKNGQMLNYNQQDLNYDLVSAAQCVSTPDDQHEGGRTGGTRGLSETRPRRRATRNGRGATGMALVCCRPWFLRKTRCSICSMSSSLGTLLTCSAGKR